MRTSVIAAVVAVGIGTGALAICWLTYRNWRKRSATKRPHARKWKRIGTLKELTIFPVKSCTAVQLERAICDAEGLICHCFVDQRLVLLDRDDEFATPNVYPTLLSIESLLIADHTICLTAPNAPAISLNVINIVNEGYSKVKQMDGYRLILVECKQEHHQWFSNVVLGRNSGLRLYVCSEPRVAKRWGGRLKPPMITIMTMHDKSIDDLNNRLSKENQAEFLQFRANMLIESAEDVSPFDEDNWLWLKIGDNMKKCSILRYNSPCFRDNLPQIDLEDYALNADFQAMDVLRSYRIRNHSYKPEIGINFQVYKPGLIRVGEPVYVQYKQQDTYFSR